MKLLNYEITIEFIVVICVLIFFVILFIIDRFKKRKKPEVVEKGNTVKDFDLRAEQMKQIEILKAEAQEMQKQAVENKQHKGEYLDYINKLDEHSKSLKLHYDNLKGKIDRMERFMQEMYGNGE